MGRKPNFINFIVIAAIGLHLFHGPSCLQLKPTEVSSIKTINTKKQDEIAEQSNLIFIGIMSCAKEYKRRSLLRALYSPFTLKNSDVKVNFILGLDPDELVNGIIREEAKAYGDLFILEAQENMNQGKTYQFFRQFYERSPVKYAFVMKADTDTYLHMNHIKQLFPQIPNDHTYWGHICYTHCMCGGGYAISWDLVEWIARDPIPRENYEGWEDWFIIVLTLGSLGNGLSDHLLWLKHFSTNRLELQTILTSDMLITFTHIMSKQMMNCFLQRTTT